MRVLGLYPHQVLDRVDDAATSLEQPLSMEGGPIQGAGIEDISFHFERACWYSFTRIGTSFPPVESFNSPDRGQERALMSRPVFARVTRAASRA